MIALIVDIIFEVSVESTAGCKASSWADKVLVWFGVFASESVGSWTADVDGAEWSCGTDSIACVGETSGTVGASGNG